MPRSREQKQGSRSGGDSEMPSTVARSDEKAQRTWKETHDNAVEEYGDGERAHRTAFAALKHTYEKQGDRWVPKDEKGPSDPRSTMSTEEARAGRGKTYGGIDYYGHTKKEFQERARNLGIRGYSIAAMAAALNGVDAIVFTGGVGENSPVVRRMAVERLGFLGASVDGQLNESAAGDRDVSAAGSSAHTLVVASREDAQMAHQVRGLLDPA